MGRPARGVSRRFAGAAMAAVLGLSGTLATAAGECKFVRIAEWQVSPKAAMLVVEGAINGKNVGVALDTAANATWIAGWHADRLGLGRRNSTLDGLSPTRELACYGTSVEEFRLGWNKMRNWET